MLVAYPNPLPPHTMPSLSTSYNSTQTLTKWALGILETNTVSEEDKKILIKIAMEEIADGGLRMNISEAWVKRFGREYFIERKIFGELYL